MGQPPEVHSAALSFGPGSGPLLDAGEAWQQLGLEYDWAAQELGNELAVVPWEGPSSQSYQGAHGPYLEWLEEAGQESQQQAVAHQQAAAAYSVALVEMPTLAELSVNRTANVALLSTNFFGINAIAIALNEAAYARMWLQAAGAMQQYQAQAGLAVALNPPHNRPAPLLLLGPDNEAGPLIEEVEDDGDLAGLEERPDNEPGPLIEEVEDDGALAGVEEQALVVAENAIVAEVAPATIPAQITGLVTQALTQLAGLIGQTVGLIGNLIGQALGFVVNLIGKALGLIGAAIGFMFRLAFSILSMLCAAIAFPLVMLVQAISYIVTLVTQFVLTLAQLAFEYVPMLVGGFVTGAVPSVVLTSSAGLALPVGPPLTTVGWHAPDVQPAGVQASEVQLASAHAPVDVTAMGFAGTAAVAGVTQPSGLATVASGEFGDVPRVPIVPATWDLHSVRAMAS
ncbi:PPE family protein [Mycobacterium decipiens]|uniref:PPE family protein n=1 Tax=Mycobacterium decipiens TaxID=1430326 RepID=UPI003101AC81